MATILVCDKCRCKIPTESYKRLVVSNASGAKINDIDLCLDCWDLIRDIILNPYKYDIIDKTAGDPLKDHCANIKYPDTYDACIHFVDERKEI